MPAPVLGRVASFDPERGWGTVSSAAGTTFEFHATALTDGSRHVEAGAEVVFTVAPGRRGRKEARTIVVLVGRHGLA